MWILIIWCFLTSHLFRTVASINSALSKDWKIFFCFWTNEGKMINFSFLYFQKASMFQRWKNHADDSTIHSVILLAHATSVENNKSNFIPSMIKIYCIYWGTYYSVETHLFQDNLASEILLMTFTSNWIARTGCTIQLTPSFTILASVQFLDKLRLPSLGYDRHFRISLTHEYKSLGKNKFYKTRAGNKNHLEINNSERI